MDKILNEIEKRLSDLSISTNGDKSINEEDLGSIEQRYEISFPEVYKQFLLRYGNFTFEQEIRFRTIEKTPWSQDDNLESFSSFFVLSDESNNLEKKIEQYYDRIPTSVLPIADDSAGNLICIGVRGNYQGKIYFWDHENEWVAKVMLKEEVQGITSIDDYWENLYLVADSFIDFIRSLEIKKEEEVEDINSKIIGIHMSNDFMEKMRLARERVKIKEKREK
ncbi:SMI1/KNR4 family protein [Paenibacillus sp. NPDC058071]|uniref:SMI1/KNR4 family protein n=1 Tax=Paenibacillus sp. NPDC058071 TaxID=3346326 RepID=UPI0036DE7960